MRNFPRSVIKRTREHLLYVLRTQEELCYVRSESGQQHTLVSAAGVDAAWHWPEALIYQAAEQLQRAGIVETEVFREPADDAQPAFRITVTAKGKAFLSSGKAFRCHPTRNRRLPTSHVTA